MEILKCIVHIVIVVWSISSFLCLFFGIFQVVEYAEFGADDENYKRGKTLLIWFLLPLVAAVKVIRRSVRIAKEVKQND